MAENYVLNIIRCSFLLSKSDGVFLKKIMKTIADYLANVFNHILLNNFLNLNFILKFS